jgi:hypothetical protein
LRCPPPTRPPACRSKPRTPNGSAPLVELIPQPEVSESGFGDLLAEPLLDMLSGGAQA